MTLDQLPAGPHVFVDSNILVYSLASHDCHFDGLPGLTRDAPA